MPGIVCQGCNRQTNTSISNAWEEKPYGTATKCYAAYEDGKWVKGCSKTIPYYLKEFLGMGKSKGTRTYPKCCPRAGCKSKKFTREEFRGKDSWTCDECELWWVVNDYAAEGARADIIQGKDKTDEPKT